MAFSFTEYMGQLRSDFVDFVASESEAFRKIGTKTKTARARLIRLLFLMGAYDALSNYDPEDENALFTEDEVDEYVEMINDIIGTDHEIERTGIWHDDQDEGIWSDDQDEGIWHDIRTL